MAPGELPALVPRISVIISMNDHRGIALDAVSSWVGAQTCAPSLFEVILVLDDTVKALEKPLRSLLRRHDRLIVTRSPDEIFQYDLGAQQARGEFLFFTEPHCLAVPATVAEMIAFIDANPLDGFCVKSSPICRNRISTMERRMFEEGWQTWSQEGHWCKVILRGFGIRHGVYQDAGGFELRYGRFAEWLLAATLRVKGYRLGYAPHVCVQHVYGTHLKLFDAFIREFTEGECLLRVERPPEFCERFFGSPPEWDAFRCDDASVSPLLRRVLLRQLRAGQGITSAWRGRLTALRTYLRLAFIASTGRRGALLPVAVRIWRAKLRCYLWWFHPDRMYRAFQDYWQQTTAYCRSSYLLDHAARSAKTAATPHTTYAMQQAPAEDRFGFHGLEEHEGHHFRWSSPVAALRILLPAGDYHATIQLLDVRPMAPERELSLFLDAEPVHGVAYDAQTATLRFPVSAGTTAAPQWLIFLCTPWRSGARRSAETRLLGLPIVRIDFAPRAEVT